MGGCEAVSRARVRVLGGLQAESWRVNWVGDDNEGVNEGYGKSWMGRIG